MQLMKNNRKRNCKSLLTTLKYEHTYCKVYLKSEFDSNIPPMRVQEQKIVMLEDLATLFKMKTNDVVDRLRELDTYVIKVLSHSPSLVYTDEHSLYKQNWNIARSYR